MVPAHGGRQHSTTATPKVWLKFTSGLARNVVRGAIDASSNCRR